MPDAGLPDFPTMIVVTAINYYIPDNSYSYVQGGQFEVGAGLEFEVGVGAQFEVQR